MRRISLVIIILVCALSLWAQTDHRDVVGVSLKASPEAQRWAPVVYNSVVEMLVKAQRFQVLDLENKDQIEKEMERQKGAQFMETDESQLADFTKALAAKKTLVVKVDKVPVYANKTNGNISGYKSSVAFQLILSDVESGRATESESFQGKTSKEMLSAQAAVTEAVQSVASQVAEYIRINFPLECNIAKILETKGDEAKLVLLDMGKGQGLKVGDIFKVEYIEILNGKPLPTEIGIVRIKNLKGEDFAEAEISGKGAGKEIFKHFQTAQPLRCVQVIK